MTKNYVINNGSFTANGNFSGYTALGERVHIFGRQMEALGWKSNADVSFPFYTIGQMKTINQLNEKGETIGTADRLTALSAFKTREDIKQAHADSTLLDIEIQQEIKAQASSAGLTDAAINNLLSVAF
jgi:hypothetical protein